MPTPDMPPIQQLLLQPPGPESKPPTVMTFLADQRAGKRASYRVR